MMISPEEYMTRYVDRSYEELLSVRDDLLRRIFRFEQNRFHTESGEKASAVKDSARVNPSPDVIYQMNLEYLSILCLLLEKKFRGEDPSGENKK